jgi:hypothetical protein
MGNTIGTICYDPVYHNRFNTIILDFRTSYGLKEAHPENLNCIIGKRCEGAQIVTIWNDDTILERFVVDVVNSLNKAGATGVSSTIRFKPFKKIG